MSVSTQGGTFALIAIFRDRPYAPQTTQPSCDKVGYFAMSRITAAPVGKPGAPEGVTLRRPVGTIHTGTVNVE